MPTAHIVPQNLFSEEQQKTLDSFCIQSSGADNLSKLSEMLRNEFAIEMVLDPDVVAGFTADSSNIPGRADALARPRSEFECAVILRVCHQAGIPVTLSGGKSNLTGSATPDGGVLLSTVNLKAPEAELDEMSQTVRTGPGIILEELRKSVLQQSGGRYCFPVDPTSRAEASIGGAIACNCSGFTPGETGSFRSWLQSVRFLLPDGRLIEAERGQYISEEGAFDLAGTAWPIPLYRRPAIKNAGGPFSAPDGAMDFIDLIVGAEGIFGLVTECTLKLSRQPEAFLDIFFSLSAENDAIRFLDAVLQKYNGDLSDLRALEYFGVNCRRYMKHENRFFQKEDPVGIYIQQPLNGTDELEAAEGWLELLAEAGIDLDEDAMILLDSPKLQELFMEARHSMPAHAIETAQQRGAFTIMTDTVVPSGHFAEFLEFAHRLLSARGLDYLSFGHLGDCHLHFMLVPHKEQLDDAVEVYDALVAKSAELGGVYSGEHGTGKRKRKDFLCCYGPEAAEQVRRSRQAVDPQIIFNRGNVIEP
jgi:D-lactate dehydrogenase (cytochrome)